MSDEADEGAAEDINREQAASLYENEAEHGDDKGGSEADGDQVQDSSEEEEEEEDNEYDLTDKFIAEEDEDDEGDEDGGSREGKRRKHRQKRRREKSAELDDDDYQLLADNQVTGIRRKDKSARKRIRKQQDDHSKTEAQRIQEELFGIDNGAALEEEGLEDSRPAAAAPTAEADEFSLSEDEMDDFIDDDDGDGSKRRARYKARGAPQGVSSHGIQEMQEVFGDVDDLLTMYAERRTTALEGIDEEDEEAVELDDEDSDAIAAHEEQVRQRKQQQRQRHMEANIEPELMERLMMLPLDERIRETDAPERFQLTSEADLRDTFSDEQLQDAARFILEQLVGPVPTEEVQPALPQIAAKARHAHYLLERGLLEVDGKPRDGRQRLHDGEWLPGELVDGLTDLTRGQRGLKVARGRTQRAAWRADPEARARVTASIADVLKEMWNQRHEIPLIACFRKELCGELLSLRDKDQPEFTDRQEAQARRRRGNSDFELGTVQAKHRRMRRWDVLWAVYDLSARWRALVRRKEKRTEAFQQALVRCHSWLEGVEASQKLEDLQAAIQDCIAETAEADSMEVLDDIDLKFKLATSGVGEQLAEDLASGARRPQRVSTYSLFKQANLDDVVRVMAMPSAQFGDNLQQYLKRNEPEDSRTMPEDLAYNCINANDNLFDSATKVLERAQQIHVLELVHEPRVRAFIRRQMDEHVLISTNPKPEGDSQLDAFHPYGCVKRLRKMPARKFNGTDLYLRIHLAQKESLIELISEVEDLETLFVRPLLEFYQSSGVSAVSNKWNELRQGILRAAVKKLVPQLQEETGNRLLSDAKEIVVEAYGDQLWKYSSFPPVQIRTEEQGILETRRFAACCWGEGRPATCLVMLDEQGSLGDTLYLPSLSGQQLAKRPSLHYNIAEDPKKAADVKRVVEFCRENRPHAIFVGARNLNCKALKEDMDHINNFILDAHAQILTSDHDTGTIEITYLEETLAELWANSAAAREEFPEHPDVVRRAVALGRLALEPLAVLSALCNSNGREILSLNLHPLQGHVPETELLKAAERNIMTAVAQVGADINVMASNMWQASSLPFVAGLGPRKAQSLLQAVQAQEFALNRVSLWKEIWKPGNVVFRNCGAFLKITARTLKNEAVEPIDSARIEPLSYKLAFQIARQAVGSNGGGPEQDIIDAGKAMSRPEMVEAVNLEELHDRLAADSANPESYNQISTLVDIAMEFIVPSMELRPGNPIELSRQKETQFWWMVGESPENLKKGRRVEAVVRYVGQNEAYCRLPELGNMDATLNAADISSNSSAIPTDYLKIGQSVAARIKLVRPEEFSVDLTTASADLNDDAYWEEKYSKNSNQFYHVLTTEERKAIEAEKRRLARSKELAKRTINHPNFRNISMTQAVKQLEDMPVGEAIFRPNPKGTDAICLAIKVHATEDGDIIIHKDIREGKKRGGHLTLGTPLKITISHSLKKEETFEDLDEIMARYVEPLLEKYQEVINHRKFREGSWEDVREVLRRESLAQQQHHQQQQVQQPGNAFYALCLDRPKPGALFIGFVLPTANRTPHKAYFAAYPEGFLFRDKMYSSVERVLGIFKRNPAGPRPAPPMPAPDMMPPTMQPPLPGQYAGFNPYVQAPQYNMQGAYAHSYEPQGMQTLTRHQQQHRVYR